MEVAVRGLNAFLMVCLGLGLGAWLAHRRRLSWGLYGIGAATFVASQVVHIPFNSLVLNPALIKLGWPDPQTATGMIGWAIVLGLSAGVFEEGARYLAYRYWARQARSWEDGLMMGVGHGGIEAVLLGLLAGYALFQALALREVDLATVVPADQLEAARVQLETFWALPWYSALLGALERLFAICVQLSMSVLVLQSFTRRQWFWLPLAVGWHTVVDALAVAASVQLGVYWTELLIGLSALASLVIVFALRRPMTIPETVNGPPPVPVLPPSMERPPTADQLNDSRFAGQGPI